MTNPDQLSPQLQSMMDYIRDFKTEQGYAPSVREIGSALAIPSTSTVHALLRRLETAVTYGEIQRNRGPWWSSIRITFLLAIPVLSPAVSLLKFQGVISYLMHRENRLQRILRGRFLGKN